MSAIKGRTLGVGPVSLLLVLAMAAPAGGEKGAGPALSKADRERIELQGARFIQALGSKSPESTAAVVRDIFAKETLQTVGEARLVRQLAGVRERFGELQFHHSEIAEAAAGSGLGRVLHVYARAKGAQRWQDLQFRLEKGVPHKIQELVFIAEVAEPVYLPNGAITDPTTRDWLDGYVDKLAAENDFAGSILIARGDQAFYERSVGFADAERTRAVTPATRFNRGNKMFTALAVAQLAEQGKLGYSDPLGKFLPDFPDAGFARQATVGHLLSHTSGVNEYWTDDYVKHRSEVRDTRQMLPWVYKAGIGFQPGTRFQYSNSNFILAGAIVEKVSGTDYFDYVRERIYAPLRMTETDSYTNDGTVAGLAEPLKRGAAGWEKAEQGWRGSAAGGGYSTPRDMLRFARGLIAGKVVSPETLRLMTTSKTRSLAADTDYGYGFILGNEGNVRSYGHGGFTSGVNFEFRYFPREDLTLVVFCNQDNGAYDDLRKNVVKLITGAR
jgi:CubicO group peptidase (beta-lactamase class C family)